MGFDLVVQQLLQQLDGKVALGQLRTSSRNASDKDADVRPLQPGQREDVLHPFGHHGVVQNLLQSAVLLLLGEFFVGGGCLAMTALMAWKKAISSRKVRLVQRAAQRKGLGDRQHGVDPALLAVLQTQDKVGGRQQLVAWVA